MGLLPQRFQVPNSRIRYSPTYTVDDFKQWEGSRHIPCAATLKKQSYLSRSGRHSERACYFLNGLAVKRKSHAVVTKNAAR